MPDMQITIRFRRKSCNDVLMFPAGKISINNRANEIGLHEPPLRAHLPGHRALPRGDRRRRPARVALGHDPAPGDPRGAVGARGRHRPALGARPLPRGLPRPELRVHPRPGTRRDRGPGDPGRGRRGRRRPGARGRVFDLAHPHQLGALRAGLPRGGVALGRRLRRDHRPAPHRGVAGGQRRRRAPRHRRRRGRGGRRGAPQRPGDRAGDRRDRRVPRDEGGLVVHSSLWLTALLALPALGALVVARLRAEGAAYTVGVAVAGLEAALSLVVVLLYNAHVAGAGTFDFAGRWVLSAPFGLAYDVSLDGISLLMVALTALVVLLALLGARERRREGAFVAWLLLLTSFTMGSFVAHDLLEFFIFFELTLVPAYFIIAQWGGAARSRAALKFFVYTFTGSAFLFAGALYLAFAHQHQVGGDLTFAYGARAATTMSHSTAVWLFSAFAIAFAVKSPIFPLHTWSPLAYAEAPTAGSIELSALLAKLGSYGLLRVAVGLAPLALTTMRPVLLTLAVLGILWGSALACVTPDLKRLVAYSSLAQMGFITLGVVTGSQIAMVGAVLLMFNHGVITAGFFLLIGFIERRRGTATIADLAGLQGPAPVLAALFTVVMLASIGLPGLSGFVSEYLILIGAFATHAWWAVVATLGVVLAALYLLWAYQRVFHGRAQADNARVSDATAAERWVLVPVVVLIVALGVVPRPVLDKITPSVHQLIEHVAPAGVTK